MRTLSPPSVVIVQDGITWAVWFAASAVVAITYDWLCARLSANNSLKR